MPIRRLDRVLIDRIAAGEVVERPAAAVKELVENALDAGARRIEVTIEGGGRRLIRVVDDGAGMDAADLELAVERHATSKLPDGDLARIGTLGFRGEALPSIASVALLSIATRARGADSGHALQVDAGHKGAVRPGAQPPGTRVEVRDLFAATPARLAFLKSDKAEARAVADGLRRLAMAHPQVRFALASSDTAGFDYPNCGPGSEGLLERLTQVLGRDFRPNALAGRSGARGRHARWLCRVADVAPRRRRRAAPLRQRPRGEGQAVARRRARRLRRRTLPAGRHPTVALFVGCDPGFVDVNVHPAKAEVRFRDPGLVRGLIVGALKQTLAAALHRATPSAAAAVAGFARRNGWTERAGASGGLERGAPRPRCRTASAKAASRPSSTISRRPAARTMTGPRPPRNRTR